MNLRVYNNLMLLPVISLSLLSPNAKKANKSSEKSEEACSTLLIVHLQWHMAEQIRHRFPIVRPSDRLSQDH